MTRTRKAEPAPPAPAAAQPAHPLPTAGGTYLVVDGALRPDTAPETRTPDPEV